MAPKILVVGMDCLNRERLEQLADDLETTLRHPVTVAIDNLSPQSAFDPARGQFNSSLMLTELCRHRHPDHSRVLGVSEADLFIPILTFVFGEAQRPGTAAVVSVFRLHPERYGLPADENLVRRRLLIEAIHELGHTGGLTHCHIPTCAMAGSTYPEDIDLKKPEMCPACTRFFRDGLASPTQGSAD